MRTTITKLYSLGATSILTLSRETSNGRLKVTLKAQWTSLLWQFETFFSSCALNLFYRDFHSTPHDQAVQQALPLSLFSILSIFARRWKKKWKKLVGRKTVEQGSTFFFESTSVKICKYQLTMSMFVHVYLQTIFKIRIFVRTAVSINVLLKSLHYDECIMITMHKKY